MKFNEFLHQIVELAKKHPEIMDMDVVTSKDSEGNAYNRVYFSPSVGHYDGVIEFDNTVRKTKYNAVCLN